METTKKSSKPKTKTKLSRGLNKVRAKALNTFYGHPAKDMRLIVITGSTGKTTVAHFVHEILSAADQRVAVLASEDEIKMNTLHKFLSEAWKAGANYVVVTSPVDTIEKGTFMDLPIYIALMTNYIPSALNAMSAEEYEKNDETLFDMAPENVILNRDDHSFDTFTAFRGKNQTITYGRDSYADVRIEDSTLYKLGSEAKLNLMGDHLTVASFLNTETAVSYMAAAAAIAKVMDVSSDSIVEGISNYDPDGINA